MIKICGVIFCILAVLCVYLNFRVDALKAQNKRLITYNNALKINSERLVKNENEYRIQVKTLQEEIKKDESGFDWNYNLSRNPVRIRVSKECLSCD